VLLSIFNVHSFSLFGTFSFLSNSHTHTTNKQFVSCVEKSKQKKQLLKFLSFHFANSSRWRERQVYILTVDKLLEYKAIEPKMFTLYVFKKLIDLVNDKIPNIRICIAKCFSVTLQGNCKL